MSYTQANLNSSIANMVGGEYSAAVFLEVANRALRDVLLEVDMRSTVRKSALTPNIFSNIFQYTCPSDLKGNAIIDIANQINRGRFETWRLTTITEFDRMKLDSTFDFPLDVINEQVIFDNYSTKSGLVAFGEDDMVRTLYVSKTVNDSTLTIDSLNSIGNWVVYGDGTNLTADTSNYVVGTASLNWDIDATGGTTAGIVNSTLTSMDVSNYLTTGNVFVWAYASNITNLTNYKIRLGSDATNYYEITATTDSEGGSFQVGWNLIRFDFDDKTTTLTPVPASIDYCALFMTKDAAKTSETDYRFDDLQIKDGKNFNIIYYSKYLWISNTGTRLENATATTDILMADSDEINMIESKTAEYMEKYLKNPEQAALLKESYELAKKQYQTDNPSQKLSMSYTYKDYIK